MYSGACLSSLVPVCLLLLFVVFSLFCRTNFKLIALEGFAPKKKKNGGGVVLVSQNSCRILSEFYGKMTCREKDLWRGRKSSHISLGLKCISDMHL